MANYIYSPGIEGFPRVGAAPPYGEGVAAHKVGLDFDWAEIITARAAEGHPPLVAGDTIVIGSLPKGTVILASASYISEPNDAAAAISVGVTGTAGAIAAGVATDADQVYTPHVVAPVSFTAAKDIILTLTGLPTVGKTRVTMLVTNLV